MASKQLLSVLAVIAVTAVLPVAMGAEFVVGDDSGWKPDFNYTEWAADKVFRVGDHLVFNYTEGVHNVIPVNGEKFKACDASGAENVLSSGNDMVHLKVDGRKWYICGKGDHCTRGQKLVINVLTALGEAPSSPPSSSATGIASYSYKMLMGVAAAAAMVIMA
ncbi:hypothetical protein Cni_G08185 [Canna indica]|uniref:Phytocyanin domain-containing protein n=1 Tax=Canna indica TaxID=4628 RepID=A0AAQ3Q6I7_9LILI|nr:hypothetical protein Cni_G08185 [Canna indica]